MKKILYNILLILVMLSCSSEDIRTNVKINDKIKEIESIYDLFTETEYRLNIPDNLIIDQSFGRIKEDINKNLYIPNQDGSIFKFDKNYNFVNVLKRVGLGPEEYGLVIDYTIDESENIYIYDLTKFTILKYDKNHNFIANHKCKNYNVIRRLEYYKNNIYCTFGNGELYKFDSNLKILKEGSNYDEIAEKYFNSISHGDIDFFNNNIFSYQTNHYEVTKRDLDFTIIKTYKPERKFKQLKKKYYSKFNDKTDKGFDGNVIIKMDVMSKIILITVGNGSTNSKYSVFDILTHNGELLKSKIKGKKFELFNKLDAKTLIKLEFSKENGKIIPKIVKLTLKKEYE